MKTTVLGPPACWLQMVGLLSLHDHVKSIPYKKSLYIYKDTHTLLVVTLENPD